MVKKWCNNRSSCTQISQGWPGERAQEKGIDTALAIEFVTMAVDALYDIGVIMSTDTDLLPAIEFVRSRFAGERHVAVAAWRSRDSRRRLSIPGANVWCHWLTRDDYDSVADPTNYNRGNTSPPRYPCQRHERRPNPDRGVATYQRR